MSNIDLRLGNVLDVLRTMDAESVHCIVTSPPYWGLRAYGTDPQVWRNGSEPCDVHQWGEAHTASMEYVQGNPEFARPHREHKSFSAETNTCTRCGAWRGELGLEPTPELFVEHIVAVMREARRVLRDDGTLWLNIGDSFASGKGTCFNPGGGEHSLGKEHKDIHPLDRGNKSTLATSGLKPKDLVGIPWRVAFALQADGWYLRSDIIWHKPNPMPESVRDRPTKAHEYIFLMSKSPRYYYDADAVRENFADERMGNPGNYHNGYSEGAGRNDGATKGKAWLKGAERGGRNRRSVWTVTTHPYSGAHFATFPPKLIEPCILAATSERGVCPACGAPWVREVKASGGTIGRSWHKHEDDIGKGMSQYSGLSGGVGNAADESGEHYRRETLGWRASCACDAGEPIPATVLDPFNGAGTTGLVALQHGRNYIGIDLKAEYLEMTRKRLDGVQMVAA